MKSDHMLLQLAANAAGLNAVYEHVGVADGFHVGGTAWDPLCDNRDALKLALCLHISLGLTRRFAVEVKVEGEEWITYSCLAEEREATIRRAIVNMAAYLGMQKEKK